jgi:hypothetical protein
MTVQILALKAYVVLEDCENTGDVFFAKHAIVARRLGAHEFNDGEFKGITCRRAPWADQYAPGPVPFKAKFAQGWWQECQGCGQTIREDAEDDDGNLIDFDIVEFGDCVYCTPACRETHLIEMAETDRIKAAVVGHLTDRILRTMPGAVIAGRHHVYVRSGPWPPAVQQGSVEFTFPGARYGMCCLRFDKVGEKPHFSVPRGDMPAFNRWREAGYPPHMMDAQDEALTA